MNTFQKFQFHSLAHTDRASCLANSMPSVMMRGWTPSEIKRSACFKVSPISNTLDVVPSPVISSWAVQLRAIMTATGFWICCKQFFNKSAPKNQVETLFLPFHSTKLFRLWSISNRPLRQPTFSRFPWGPDSFSSRPANQRLRWCSWKALDHDVPHRNLDWSV